MSKSKEEVISLLKSKSSTDKDSLKEYLVAIEILDLDGGGVDPSSIKVLSELLKTNTKLLTLNLGNNEIGDDGTVFFSEMLKENHMIQHLDLTANKITDTGMSCLVKSIEHHKSLATLNIGKNILGPKTIELLGTKLSTDNIRLKELSLEENKIELDWQLILGLFKSLNTNTFMTNLDLTGNVVNLKELEDISRALTNNSNLKSLKIYVDTMEVFHPELCAAIKRDSELVKNSREKEAHGQKIQEAAKCIDKYHSVFAAKSDSGEKEEFPQLIQFSQGKNVQIIAQSVNVNALDKNALSRYVKKNQESLEKAVADFVSKVSEFLSEHQITLFPKITFFSSIKQQESMPLITKIAKSDDTALLKKFVGEFPEFAAIVSVEDRQSLLENVKSDGEVVRLLNDIWEKRESMVDTKEVPMIVEEFGAKESLAKELKTYMTKTHVKNFNEAQTQNKVKEYVEEYIKLHKNEGVRTEEDFYSLLLNAAISLEDVNQVADILEKIKGLKIVSVLTSADDSHHNPISVALYSDNMKVIELIDCFIELQKTKLSPSSTMSEQVAKNMRLALEATPEGMSIDYCLDHFLVPLYEEKVIDMLLGCSEESD